MTASQPTPPSSTLVTYWQTPGPGPEDVLIPALRARLVALVAALVIQAAIAAIQILPDLPGRDAGGFWAKFAVLEFLAAAILSGAFGSRVRPRDVPAIGLLVLGFIVVPALAIALGGMDAARIAHIDGTTATVSSWLGTAFYATLFSGLPLIALAAPWREPHGDAPR